MRAGAAALLLVAACSPRPAPPASGDPPPAPATPHPSASAPVPSAAPVASTRPRSLLPDGCHSRTDPDLPARAKLESLRADCVFGMVPLVSEPIVVRIASEASHEITFQVEDPTKCVRVVAAAGAGAVDLDLGLVDPGGSVLARDDLQASFALIGAAGPVCSVAGPHRVTVTLHGSSAEVAIGVWRAR